VPRVLGWAKWGPRGWPARPALVLGALVFAPPSLGGRPLEEEREHSPTSWSSSLSSLVRLLPLSPPHPPVWLPEGPRRSEGQLHSCTSSFCGNSRSDPNRSTSAISAETEIRRSSSFTVCVRVLRGAATCGTKSLRRCYRNIDFYTILRSASSSTLMWERNPHVRSTRVCHQIQVNLYNITNR
jgi:hypothetical protein